MNKCYGKLFIACLLTMAIVGALLPYVGNRPVPTTIPKEVPGNPAHIHAAIVNYGNMKMSGDFTFIPEPRPIKIEPKK